MALRLCLERLLPPVRDRAVNLSLPKAETATEVHESVGRVVQAVAEGEITPGEAQTVASILDVQRRAIETADLEQRIAELERRGSS